MSDDENQLTISGDLTIVRMSGGLWREDIGEHVLVTHGADECDIDVPCPIHAPSNHHMTTWPLNWDLYSKAMERICPHGRYHPDPDSMAFLLLRGRRIPVHRSCDGCCEPQPAEDKESVR